MWLLISVPSPSPLFPSGMKTECLGLQQPSCEGGRMPCDRMSRTLHGVGPQGHLPPLDPTFCGETKCNAEALHAEIKEPSHTVSLVVPSPAPREAGERRRKEEPRAGGKGQQSVLLAAPTASSALPFTLAVIPRTGTGSVGSVGAASAQLGRKRGSRAPSFSVSHRSPSAAATGPTLRERKQPRWRRAGHREGDAAGKEGRGCAQAEARPGRAPPA